MASCRKAWRAFLWTLLLCGLAIGLGLWWAHDAAAGGNVPAHVLIKGLAQVDWTHNEDRAAVGAAQWYAWSEKKCADDYGHCTPMNRDWQLPETLCPPYLLLGNEPTNAEPAGFPIDAGAAVSVALTIKSECPHTALVVANIHIANGDGADARTWLADFYDGYVANSGRAYAGLVGLHCYQQAATCRARLDAIEALAGFTGQYWITETGWPVLTEWQQLLAEYAIDPRIDRVYMWTNRDSGDGMEAVAADGSLTAYGQAFHDWPAISWQTQLPLVQQQQAYP